MSGGDNAHRMPWENEFAPTSQSRSRLDFPYYYAQVVGNSVDPNRAGCVQARVSGVTDGWQDKYQPWFAPQLNGGLIQVPQKGFWLLVKFNNGDINQGMYYAVSQTREFLPSEYVLDYPDVAVMNLGEVNYTYVHNRRSHTTAIKNPGNNSDLLWNAAGEIVISSSNASDEPGVGPVPVLTEATIDIFTCRPVGGPGTAARAGSEYFRVPHISQNTVDAIRGKGSSSSVVVKGIKDDEVDGVQKREIVGKNSTYEIPFLESPAAKRRGGKTNVRIVLGTTANAPLAEFLSNYTDDDAKNCAHYLVGLGDGDPDVLSTMDDKSNAKNLGFIQCADITYDCTLGADMRDRPNMDAVGVVFYGDGILNKYQSSKLLDIVNHVKQAGKLDEIEVVAYRPPSPSDSRFGSYLNMKNLEGAY